MKIIIFSNIPSPYFVNYLNELGKLAEVFAVFERKTASDRDKSWEIVNAKSFSYTFLKGIPVGNEASLSFQIKRFIKQYKDRIIIFANPTTPTGIVGINYCKRKKIGYCLQSEGGIPKSGKGLKESIKKKHLSGASLYLTGMAPGNDYFRFYGAPIDKIKQYPFASLAKNDILSTPVSTKEKAAYKTALGVKQSNMVLYVGRMIPSKGVDTLLKAFGALNHDYVLYCIGGKPTDTHLKIINDIKNKNVHFVEHAPLNELKKYYLASDVFVLPTRHDTWGLVVNEAMSFGLPVITTKMCVAGLELIEDGVNGYLVDVDDSETLSKRIELLFTNRDLRFSMAKNNIDKIQRYNYSDMAKIIYQDLLEYQCQKIRTKAKC